jgi:hypothetical protein
MVKVGIENAKYYTTNKETEAKPLRLARGDPT